MQNLKKGKSLKNEVGNIFKRLIANVSALGLSSPWIMRCLFYFDNWRSLLRNYKIETDDVKLRETWSSQNIKFINGERVLPYMGPCCMYIFLLKLR